MNKKRLLILPASSYQVPFIEKARDMGFCTIVADDQEENIGHKIADLSFNISSTDFNSILDIIQSYHIDGVLSPCSDISLITVAFISKNLGLIGPDISCVKTLTSKLMFRIFQEKNDLNHPKFQSIEPKKEKIILNFPAVIKPDKSSGSKGVFIVNSLEELQSKIKESINYSLNHRVILEEEIIGHHLTVEGIIYKGNIKKLFLSDRITAPSPYVATWGHIMPSIYSNNETIINEITSQIKYIFDSFNYFNGPFDADIVISSDSNQVYILEITPRVGGNSLVELIKYAHGFDMVEYAIDFALGNLEPKDTPSPSKPLFTKLKLLGSIDTSFINYDINYVNHLKTHPNIKRIAIDYLPDSLVKPFINGRNRAGEVIIQAKSMSELCNLEFSLIDSQIKFNPL